MAKTTTAYVCQECATSHAKWSGRCESCGAWNTLVEEALTATPRGVTAKGGSKLALVPLKGTSARPQRRITQLAEFDRVCGGGLVPGSALLVGGDPGIGKSTILLQVAAALANNGLDCVYISGEEAVDQVRLRADRLGLADAPVALASATNVRDILATLETRAGTDVLVIDSIQTMFVDTLDSAPGTVSQVRASAQELIRCAKRRGFSLLLVGHVTKDGAIAGPKVLEHMVDTVLYFEGDRGHRFRILRAVKNRFGPTDEIGVFEMTDTGLVQVTNPSELFLTDRRREISGAAVFAGIEGTRPLLVEIQVLLASSPLGTPRRAVVGWDNSRLAMILAVLDTRCGLNLGGHDVYLNVAGGLRVTEPAADLAVAAALLSAHCEQPLPPDSAVFGEIGLAGEVRPVGQTDVRLKEAAKLGFARALTPPRSGKRRQGAAAGINIVEIDHVADLAGLFASPTAGQYTGKQAVG